MKLKMPARLPYEAALFAALMLGSCDKLPHSFTAADYDRLHVADVNARNAIAKVDELDSRVSDLEAKLNM